MHLEHLHVPFVLLVGQLLRLFVPLLYALCSGEPTPEVALQCDYRPKGGGCVHWGQGALTSRRTSQVTVRVTGTASDSTRCWGAKVQVQCADQPAIQTCPSLTRA